MNDEKKLLDVDEVLEVARIFKREPSLIELDSVEKVLIVGDTHGDYQISKRLIDRFLKEKDLLIVILGDYVDRGPQQVENVNFLFLKKKEHPEKIVLLRGNHEWRDMNVNYGFLQLVQSTFDQGKDIYNKYEDVFSQLPIALRIGSPNILALHGGIPLDPKGSRVITLDEIKQIPKGIKEFYKNDILDQIQWNDPKENMKEFTPSFRGIGYYFGSDVFREFRTLNEFNMCVRSHEAFPKPKLFFEEKLISIFSSISYGIEPQILMVDNKTNMKFMTL